MVSTLSAEMVRSGLTPLFARAEQPQTLTSEETAEVIRSADIAVALLEHRWTLIQSSIEQGTELTRLIEMLQDFLTLVDRCASVLDDIRAKAPGFLRQPAEAEKLHITIEKLKELGTTATKIKQFVEKPFPPIDIDSLPPNRHERNPAGFVSFGDLAEKLRSRGAV